MQRQNVYETNARNTETWTAKVIYLELLSVPGSKYKEMRVFFGFV
jgi:hypothetical protein